MEYKSLVTKSSETPAPVARKWNDFTSQIRSFTKGIKTSGVDEKNIAGLSSIVSGMPTIFARAQMFRKAIDVVADDQMKNSSLIDFYRHLISEWRGLITCIALNPNKLKIKRIELEYSDGLEINKTSNLYEPKGSFGNMLFEKGDHLWRDTEDPHSKKFMDVILYRKADQKLITLGGTTPDSILFTGVSYNLSGENAPYILETKDDDSKTGAKAKLVDPIPLKKIDQESLKKLHGYVTHILSKIPDLEAVYTKNGFVSNGFYERLRRNLSAWLSEMDAFRQEKNWPQSETIEIPQVNKFGKPFGLALNYSTSYYGYNGNISTVQTELGISFDPDELLLPNQSTLAMIDDEGNPNYLQDKPVLLLKASHKNALNKKFKHFTLPLTPKGIKIFGNSLGTVLGLKDDNMAKSRLVAIYDDENYTLEVKLSLYSADKKLADVPPRTYKITIDSISNKDILLWPNFVSPEWGKYFVYSEIPHNSHNWKAIPFCAKHMGTSKGYQPIIDNDNPNEFEYLVSLGSKGIDVNYAELKVELSPQVAGTKYEYEIYESQNPILGFMMRYENALVGYIMVEYGKFESSAIMIKDDLTLSEARLGIDFGSTNTAIAYSRGNEKAQGFKFVNRRVSLLNSDDSNAKNNDVKPAGEDEVFFFQNDEILSNQIKSVLAIHDFTRISNPNNESQEALLKSEVKGGFPCFEKNLPIEDRTDTKYLLNFGTYGIGASSLIHNMKWDEDSTDKLMNSYRSAYLKTLLLQAYADLFSLGLYPKTLKWSYPSSFTSSLLNQYVSIWQDLKTINPLLKDGTTLVIDGKQGTSASINSGNDFFKDPSGATHAGGWNSQSPPTSNDGWGNDNSSTQESKLVSDSSSSWGNSGGWGSSDSNNNQSSQESIKKLTYNPGPIRFDFKKINANAAMTESEAVANYLFNGNVGTTSEDGAITLCFDIGGSTTDILALTTMRVNGSEIATAMVKQSSVRFAAQRISQSTQFSPFFKDVIIDLLNKKNIKIEGLNKEPSKYTKRTAPYFFEQIVDRLEEKEFQEFYRELGIRCPELVCVNLYVTGLIMFYAGELTKKLFTEINQSDSRTEEWDKRDKKLFIRFTGKGSRIMDWLNAIDGTGTGYYLNMLMLGMGGQQEAGKILRAAPEISFGSENSSDVKYEVAKGLASPDLRTLYMQNPELTPLEIIGEEGFVVKTKDGEIELSSDSTITAEMMGSINGDFVLRPKNPNFACPRFVEFAKYYFSVASKSFKLPLTQEDFMQGFRQMSITDYIKNTPEYNKARKNTDGFDYVAPIIILEGMYFLEEVILKKYSSLQ